MSIERPITYPKGTVKYLGTAARGVMFKIAPELPLLRFGHTAGTKKHIRKFNMDKDDERAMFEAVLESKPFNDGVIVYIDSPDEVKAKQKAKKQSEQLVAIKNALDTDVLTLTDMNKMTAPKLFDLADSIGAKCTDKLGKPYRKELLIRGIRIVLGIEVAESESEEGEEAEQEEETQDA